MDISIEAALSATDADNDIVLYQLTERPRLGTAQIEGSTLRYTPGHKAGRDSFCYTAVDAEGNTARPAKITITVEKNRTGLTYADMDGDPAHYAAVYLAQVILAVLSENYHCVDAPPVTGVLDGPTQDALASFQQLSGLPITGRLDRHTWKHLALQFPMASNLPVNEGTRK